MKTIREEAEEKFIRGYDLAALLKSKSVDNESVRATVAFVVHLLRRHIASSEHGTKLQLKAMLMPLLQWRNDSISYKVAKAVVDCVIPPKRGLARRQESGIETLLDIDV